LFRQVVIDSELNKPDNNISYVIFEAVGNSCLYPLYSQYTSNNTVNSLQSS